MSTGTFSRARFPVRAVAASLTGAALMFGFVPSAAAQQTALTGLLGRAPDALSCFERVYDAEHLARIPGQRTTSMRVSLSNEVIPGSVGVPSQPFIRIEITRRGVGRPLRAIGTCGGGAQANLDTRGQRIFRTHGADGGAICSITGEHLDDNGGDVLLAAAGDGITVHFQDGVVMRRGATVTGDRGQMIGFGRDDQVFRLVRMPDTACAALRRSLQFR